MFSRTMLCTACRASIMYFFFQGEDGIRNKGMWLEFRRVLFRSGWRFADPAHRDFDPFHRLLPGRSFAEPWNFAATLDLPPVRSDRWSRSHPKHLFANDASTTWLKHDAHRSHSRLAGLQTQRVHVPRA